MSQLIAEVTDDLQGVSFNDEAPVVLKNDGESDDSENDSEGVKSDTEEVNKGKKLKNKKKKKRKAKKKTPVNPLLHPFPTALPAPPPEDPEVAAEWERQLEQDCTTRSPHPYRIMDSPKELEIFRTPGCQSVELHTARTKLRQVELDDLKAIQKIKCEPSVNQTQLYGDPHPSHCKMAFLSRYIRASIPRLVFRDEGEFQIDHIFAITLRDPKSIKINDPGQVKIRNRIQSAEGYIGNFGIAVSAEGNGDTSCLIPQPGKIFTHPTFTQMDAAGTKAGMFYEIHPQLWGKGLMSEVFVEALRYTIEELGSPVVYADPTVGNTASVSLCVKNGMVYKRSSTNNPYQKVQLVHEITREEWFKLHRHAQPVDRWGGKVVCRWCMNPRLAPPTIQCKSCEWARYCSRECQRADWLYEGGHQSECEGRMAKST